MKISPLNIIRLLSIVLGITVLAGCSSNNSLVSSFSQRKYTKGYFADGTGEKTLVNTRIAVKQHNDYAIGNRIQLDSSNNLHELVSQALIQSTKKIASIHTIVLSKEPKIVASFKPIKVERICNDSLAEKPQSANTDDTDKNPRYGLTAWILIVVALILFYLGAVLAESLSGIIILDVLGAILIWILALVLLIDGIYFCIKWLAKK